MILAACTLLSSAAWAHFRIIEQVESSYELTLDKVLSFPGSTAGTIIFRECPECESRALRVTADSRYFVNGSELVFSDFQRLVADIQALQRAEAATGVYVHYDIETQNVNRIRVNQRRP